MSVRDARRSQPHPPSRAGFSLTEGDLIVGKNQGSVIGTLVEHQTRLIRLMHLPARDADSLRTVIATALGDLPPTLVRSITRDQGIEWRATSISPPTSAHQSTFATPARLGSARAMRTPTGCYANTSPRAPTLTGTHPSTPRRRGRDKQPATPHSRRPQSRTTFHRAASLTRSSTVCDDD